MHRHAALFSSLFFFLSFSGCAGRIPLHVPSVEIIGEGLGLEYEYVVEDGVPRTFQLWLRGPAATGEAPPPFDARRSWEISKNNSPDTRGARLFDDGSVMVWDTCPVIPEPGKCDPNYASATWARGPTFAMGIGLREFENGGPSFSSTWRVGGPRGTVNVVELQYDLLVEPATDSRWITSRDAPRNMTAPLGFTYSPLGRFHFAADSIAPHEGVVWEPVKGEQELREVPFRLLQVLGHANQSVWPPPPPVTQAVAAEGRWPAFLEPVFPPFNSSLSEYVDAAQDQEPEVQRFLSSGAILYDLEWIHSGQGTVGAVVVPVQQQNFFVAKMAFWNGTASAQITVSMTHSRNVLGSDERTFEPGRFEVNDATNVSILQAGSPSNLLSGIGEWFTSSGAEVTAISYSAQSPAPSLALALKPPHIGEPTPGVMVFLSYSVIVDLASQVPTSLVTGPDTLERSYPLRQPSN